MNDLPISFAGAEPAPTGADAMKEALQKCRNALLALGVGSGSQMARDAIDAANEALAAQVEAQPAAAGLPGWRADKDKQGYISVFNPEGDEVILSPLDVTMNRRARMFYQLAEVLLSAPAAPLVGTSLPFNEAKARIMALPEDDVRGLAVSQFILLQLADKYAPASPAAPAGVPTDPIAKAFGLHAKLSAPKQWAVVEPRQPNSFHRSAADSSEASGSAIPARPTLPGDEHIKAAATLDMFMANNPDGTFEIHAPDGDHLPVSAQTLRALLGLDGGISKR